MYCSRSSILNFLLIISIFIYTANSKQIRKNSVSKKPPNFSDLNKITVGYSSFKTTQGLKLRAALGQISAKTCIEFEERNKDIKSDKGFTFKSSNECYAPNGPTNRNKKYTEYVKFSEQCAPNIEDITSLILRMIGLINPINRPDRNNYVTVNTRKMMSKDRKLTNPFNFKEVELYNTSFDFSSLALYKQYKIGNALGIASKIPSINNVTDNRYEPSFNDYKMLNQIYCSNIVIENKTVCENGGYNYPRFPYHCVCPDYYDGDNCSFIKKSDESCSKYIQTTLNSTLNRVGVLFHGSNACYQEIFSPTGRNVSIHIDTVYMKTSLCTKDNGVEVKFLPDLGASGLRLCGHHRNIQLYSNATKMLVAFNGKNIFDHILVTFKLT